MPSAEQQSRRHASEAPPPVQPKSHSETVPPAVEPAGHPLPSVTESPGHRPIMEAIDDLQQRIIDRLHPEYAEGAKAEFDGLRRRIGVILGKPV